jgi:hypothetical protein
MPEHSATTADLPAPYDRDPAAWAPSPPHAAKSFVPGWRIVEGKAADATLTSVPWTTLPADELRRLLLLAAGAFDAAELQSTHAPRYRKGLKTRAYLVAWNLWNHDQEHGTSRGAIPATHPWWDTEPGDKDTPRLYLRQELTALLDTASAA